MSAFAATASSEPATSTITLPGGGERVVWRQGTGRPLLLIQGMSGTHDHWGDVLVQRLVGDGRALVTVNHRGVYGTAAPEAGYAIADLADDQAAALDALGVDEPIDVFGISMGGMTALHLALRHPGKVRTLALGCTTAGGGLMTFPSQEDIQLLLTAQQSGDVQRALQVAYELNFSADPVVDAERFAAFTAASVREPVPLPVVFTQAQAISMHDVGDQLASLTIPTAVLHGTADRMLPYPNAVAIHERLPGEPVIETFDGAGHLFFWQDGERTADILGALAARA